MQFPGNLHSAFWNTTAAKKVSGFLLPMLLLISVMAYAGKEFWESKPYDQWTQKECQRLLENSPWAKELNLTGVGGGGNDATDNQAPYIKYIVQLRTAPPVRQAMVRQNQIINKYDTLAAEQKQQFNKSAQAFLTGAPSDAVLVGVSFTTNNREYLRNLLRHWQTQTTDLLKNSVYLSSSKGDKIPLSQFIPLQGALQEFQFVFPRQVNGKDVLAPEDKSLRLEFVYPVEGSLGDGRGFIEFKTDKMKFNNEVVY